MKSPQNHSTYKLLAPVLALCALMGLSHPAWSATAGRVVVAKGAVQATQAGQTRDLKRRSEIQERDAVTTGAASRTQLRFVDNALLTLNENSELAIQQYSFRGAGAAEDKVLMRLVRGGFRTVTGAIGKQNRDAYKVETPLASIGIRGTIYTVFYDAVRQILEVTVQEGVIVVITGTESATIGRGQQFNAARVLADGTIELFTVEEETTTTTREEQLQEEHHHDEPAINPQAETGGGDSSWENELQGGT